MTANEFGSLGARSGPLRQEAHDGEMKGVPLILRLAILAALLCCGISTAEATTWRVGKTSEYPFSVIQDAVDAAASGDTVTIGPGRYEEFRWVTIGNSLRYVEIRDKSLTILGSGRDECIIGKEVPPFPDNVTTTGIYCFGPLVDVQVRDLGFEKLAGWCLYFDGLSTRVSNCSFSESRDGILVIAPGGCSVVDSRFSQIGYHVSPPSGRGITLTSDVGGANIERCDFANCAIGVGAWWDCRQVLIEDCVVSGSQYAISFTDGASGIVRRCQVSDSARNGFVMTRSGSVVVEDCSVIMDSENDGHALWVSNGPALVVLRRNIFEVSGAVHCLGLSSNNVILQATNNHFLRNGDRSLYVKRWNPDAPETELVHFDLTGNWWGTTDVDEIATWIEDYNDNPSLKFIVDYVPLLDHPVPVEKKSLGSFKSMFR